jgi:hypothetical protein
MRDELQKRALRVLADKPGAVVRTDPARSADLAKRAQAALERPTPRPVIRIAATCSATGRPFIALTEQRDGALYLIGNELPGPAGGAGTGAGVAGGSLGSFRIEANADWRCPHCGTRDNPLLEAGLLWQCHCRDHDGHFHCVGSAGRQLRCACGKLEERQFKVTDSFAVRGALSAAASAPARSRPAETTGIARSSPAAPLPRSADGSAPRLPWRR